MFGLLDSHGVIDSGKFCGTSEGCEEMGANGQTGTVVCVCCLGGVGKGQACRLNGESCEAMAGIIISKRISKQCCQEDGMEGILNGSEAVTCVLDNTLDKLPLLLQRFLQGSIGCLGILVCSLSKSIDSISPEGNLVSNSGCIIGLGANETTKVSSAGLDFEL